MHVEKLTRGLIRIAPLILIGVLWEATTLGGLVNTAFLPSPAMIFVALADLLSGGEIAKNLFVTLFRAATGLAIGSISGVWLGLTMVRSANFRAWVTPIVGGTYSLPKSALIPLFALWFGIGNITAICAVYLACLLPMIVNTFQGVVSTPKVLIWSAQALGTGERQLLTQIYLRHALPDILTGLRIAYRHSEGRRVALSSLWRSASNLRIPSDHLEPVCNCPLRRRGTDVHHILVLAGVLETYKNFASLLCFCVLKVRNQPIRRRFD